MPRSRIKFSELPPRRQAGIAVAAAVQLGLLIAAERDIQRRPATLIRGSKTRWRLLCLINFLGPLSYFTLGRRRQQP
jgi:hypothetical protein